MKTLETIVDAVFPRRLHRLAYFLRSITVEVLTSFLYTTSTTMRPFWWWTLLIFLSAYSAFFILLPRVRDAGMSSWWIVAGILIPVVGIVLAILVLFRPPHYVLRHTSAGMEPKTSPILVN